MLNCFQMQLRNMTTHYNELNDIHNDLFMLATETLDIKLENFTNQINSYHEERSLRITVETICNYRSICCANIFKPTIKSETRLKKIAAFAFSGSIQCNRSLDFLNEELEKIDDVQLKFDELSNELDVRTEILEVQLSGTAISYDS